ncbi:hypothetical protein Tsubulata_013632 [Turnera subulata]|uniref:Peptidoglycan binding-like domain-containing protein n=1 Tax=Turnera subulata TaxID=218843 RepID=A0A9Q0J2Y6_9ROSI|nr:hypothetical protein Tsubulata_013632 [Turnera subulata]
MALKSSSHLYVSLLLLLILPLLASSRTVKSNVQSFNSLQNLEGSQKGQTTKGLNQLKKYLRTFGYYPKNQDDINLAEDQFDDSLEYALKAYQQNFNLKVTGVLDSATIKDMMIPRCGVADPINHHHPSKPSDKTKHGKKKPGKFHMVSHYAFPDGMPTWPPSKTQLTYSFLSDVDVQGISMDVLRYCDRIRTWRPQRWSAI